MPINKQKKQETVQKLKDRLISSSFVAFLNFHRLSVTKATELRRALRKLNGDYVVSKKTLILIALRQLIGEAGFEIDKKKLEGEIGIAFGGDKKEDTVLSITKEIANFAKKNSEMLKIIGGIWLFNPSAGGGLSVWVDADQIKKLAAIPPREVLLTQLAFILSQPIASLARVLSKLLENKGQN